MKKSTKRILSLFLVLMMVVSLFPTAYAAETGEAIEDEGYGSSWEDWDVQPAEEGAPIEEEPTDPFVEEPVEEPAPVEEPVEEPAPVEEPVDEPAPVEEPVVEEEPEVSYPANTFYYVGGSGLRVTVDAPEGAFPADTEMNVSELPAAYVQDVVAASGVEGEVLVAADISFANAEGALQPNGKVKVSITSAEAARVSNVKIVHIGDDNSVEEVDQLPGFDANLMSTSAVAMQSVADERTLTFEADSFSVYAIIGEVVIEDNEGSFDFETEEYKITVSYTKEAQIPLGTHLVVSQIPYDSEEYWSLWRQSFNKLNENAIKPQDDPNEMGTYKSIAAAVFFDVSLIYEGEEFEPAVPLQVNITFKQGGLPQFDGEETKVIHFGDKGTELIDSVRIGQVEGALGDGMPAGVSTNDFTYMQDGFSKVGVFTTDVYVDASAAEPAAGGVGADQLLAAVRAAGDSPTINAGKSVTDNDGDGIYELALSIQATSQQSSEASVTKSNVVMVIDVSGSMGNDASYIYYDTYTYDASTYDQYRYYTSSTSTNTRLYYGTYYRNAGTWIRPNWVVAGTGWYSGNQYGGTAYSGTVYAYETRLHATQRAACAVVDALLAYNVNDDNITDVFEITVVKFANLTATGTYNGTETIIRDSTSGTAIKNAINGLTAGGGTNWEAALNLALTEANYYKNTDTSTVDPENTSVIFLTDGFPTFYVNNNGSQGGDGGESDDNIATSYTQSRPSARNIVTAGYTLYNIFAFGSDTNTYNNHTGFAYLRALTNYAYGSGNTDNYNESAFTRQYSFNAKSTDDLIAAFKTIIDHITNNVGYAGVNLSDGVSLGATSTSVAVNGVAKDESMRYSVKDDAGKPAYDVKIDASGKATFTIYNADGTTATLTDDAAETVTTTINGTTITSKVYSVTVGSGDSAKTYKMSPATIDPETGMVKWDLAGLGILESGYTYTVAFDVWPNQKAYDIVADLNNGIYTTKEEAIAAYGITEEPEFTQVKNAIVKNADGSYSLYTNYEQSIDYYPATSETDDEGNVTWTYGDKQTQDLPHPDPLPLKGSLLSLSKVWESSLAISELNEVLWENGVVDGTSKEYQITLHLWKADTEEALMNLVNAGDTSKAYISKVVGWDADAGKYIFEKDAAVAPGMMLNVDAAAALGYDTTDASHLRTFTNDSGTTLTYYVIEEGHYYYVTEEGSDLHFELEVPLYHPMIVDGTLYNVFFGSGQTVDKMDPMYAVVATNYLKGGLNISKIVTDFEGTEIKGVEDEFAFKITLWKEENGQTSPVYTYDDQFKADNTAISGSIGYREFGVDENGEFVTLGRNVIVFEDTPNAAAKIEANKRGVNDPVYAVNNGGKTEITLRMPANGEIRIVNLPSGTKYAVEEIVDATEEAVYEYVQTESALKYSKTNPETGEAEEVIEVTGTTTGNTVNGNISGNKANIETYTNKTDAFFYVYHSSDNSIEKISFTDERVKGTYADGAYTYEFNIVDKVKDGFLYGGYYGDYGGKSEGLTAAKVAGLTYTDGVATDAAGCKAYDATTYFAAGTVRFWVRNNAVKALRANNTMEATGKMGTELDPNPGDVYFLKEVPEAYLHNRVQYVYDWSKDNEIEQLFTMTAVDDSLYTEVGFDIVVTEDGHEIARLCTTYTFKQRNSDQTESIKTTDINNAPHGFVGVYDDGTKNIIPIQANTEFIVTPNWTTLDGVKVLGTFQGYKFNTTQKGGIVKTDAEPPVSVDP